MQNFIPLLMESSLVPTNSMLLCTYDSKCTACMCSPQLYLGVHTTTNQLQSILLKCHINVLYKA